MKNNENKSLNDLNRYFQIDWNGYFTPYKQYTYYDYPWYTGNIKQDLPIETFICVNGKRQKQNNSIIYLENNTEFSIEIFNPNTFNIGCLIYLNDTLISNSHLIINKGQRVNLERYIDNNNKFMFTTYEVENNSQVLKAIASNGNIKIEFYKEYISKPKLNNVLKKYNPNNKPFDGTFVGSSFDDTFIGSSNETFLYSSNINTSFETGQISKGQQSSQSFTTVNCQFELLPFETINYKLLPQSQKPIHITDLYKCSNCKSKYKKHHKYCTNCGHKL